MRRAVTDWRGTIFEMGGMASDSDFSPQQFSDADLLHELIDEWDEIDFMNREVALWGGAQKASRY